MKDETIYIGIDPAFRKGGFWMCEILGKSAAFHQFKNVLEFDRWIRIHTTPGKFFACIENSNEQNESFDKTGTINVALRKARNVGANQAASELTYIAACDHWGKENVISLSPRQKGAKIVSEKMFQAIVASDDVTLWCYTGNQDQRDAYKLALIAKQQKKLLHGTLPV